jgi:hypothetical protein
MAAAAYSGRSRRRRSSRLSYRIGQSLEIVIARDMRCLLALDPHDSPASRDRQAVSVAGAQVIGMRLGEGRQRSQHGSGLDIGVSESGDGS